MTIEQTIRTPYDRTGTRPVLRLVPPQQNTTGGTGTVPTQRVEVFLDMGYVIRSATSAFGVPATYGRTPDPLTTALEILALRRWTSELGNVHVFDGIHDRNRRPAEHDRMIAWKTELEATGEVIVHLSPLQYLPDGGFRQKEVDTTMSFAMDDAARAGSADAIVAFTGDRDLLTAARRVLDAGVRFESACWGQRGGLRVPDVRTWTHRLTRGAFQRCTAAIGFGDTA
jgi:hypothetical protein